MNGKFEEKLARLAFGDLTPEEAAAIRERAQTDPEAAQALDMYEMMREGLKDLAEVPDDQLSKERLRHAILAQGLKPEPVRENARLSWLWMPATASLLAAAFMMFRPGAAGEPMVVLNEDKTPLFERPMLEPQFNSGQDSLMAAAPSVAPEQPEETPAPTRSTPRAESRPTMVASNDARRDSAPTVRSVDPAPSATRTEPKPQTEERRPAMAATDPFVEDTINWSTTAPIVIIDNDLDVSTGAFRATEVGSASNVVIGG
jgi:hypothetical protein